MSLWGFPGGAVVKNPPINGGDVTDMGLTPGLGTYPGGGYPRQPTPVFLPGESLWTEEPGGLMVHEVTKSQTLLNDSACMHRGLCW